VLRRRDLTRALVELPENQRIVLLLVAVEGLPYAETARALKVPIGTVMSRLSRARENLRERMGEDVQPALRRVK
jgi:RNA polymerase sigma-70 factor (ECF subfamily)